ncbi:MAG: 3-oxoacyl-ACP reductase [Candidatus Rokubacteria bacterium RIFCSPLOWO2_12_FULL_71_22]|nr:MAG: 3-oxoacyl-ACP reductase [Candidatus Rokubacteria bacterium RIFCSPLOWO2_12_FULL_71_22]
MNLGLAGKVALVTGAGRDIGREIALVLGREGAAVAVNYAKSKAEAEATASEIREGGGRALAIEADATDYAAVKRMAERVTGELGPIDVLVNNAGMVRRKFFLESRPEEWPAQIDIGLYGVLNCCHAIAPGMVERKGGRIVNIAGDSARVGQAQLSITAAARGGVLSLTRTLARELGRAGITVNAVTFGWVETGHADPSFWDANREKILQAYPIKRLGRPGDIAPLVAFLASDLASWITGQTVSVSGGYTTI